MKFLNLKNNMLKKVLKIGLLSCFLFFCLSNISGEIRAYKDPLAEDIFQDLLPEPE